MDRFADTDTAFGMRALGHERFPIVVTSTVDPWEVVMVYCDRRLTCAELREGRAVLTEAGYNVTTLFLRPDARSDLDAEHTRLAQLRAANCRSDIDEVAVSGMYIVHTANESPHRWALKGQREIVTAKFLGSTSKRRRS